MEFLLRTLTYYILSHIYLIWHFYKLAGRKIFFWLSLPILISMGLFPFVFHQLPPGLAQKIFGLAGALWLPLSCFFLLFFILLDCSVLLTFLKKKITRVPEQKFSPGRRRLLSLFLFSAGIYGYAIYEAHTQRVNRLEIPTTKLPPGLDKLRLAFAADLHIGPQTGINMLRSTVDMILAQKPDIIMLGGDIFDDAFQGKAPAIAELRRLQAPLGTFAVLGNHDAFGDHRFAVEALTKANISLLQDQAVLAGPLRIVGLDDPRVVKQKGSRKTKVVALLGQADPKRFCILLDHRPKIRQETIGLFDLQLSGHSHGGQILPLKPLLENRYGTVTGFSRHKGELGESMLFVTTGIGYSKLPIRLLVPPEVVVLDLVRSPAEENKV